MPIETDSPYRIPLAEMQTLRQHNLVNHLLRLNLAEEDTRKLAKVALTGCLDALEARETEAAFTFAELWSIYNNRAERSSGAPTAPLELTLE